jgi:multiple sugar transport system permease protein
VRARAWWRAGLFLGPMLLLLAVFVLVPVLGTLLDGLWRDVVYLPRQFAGLTNYGLLLHDPAFWQAARFTVLFVLVSVPLELALGLIVALVLNESFRGRGVLRACVLIPWAIPAAVSARIFELVYNQSHGAANWALGVLGLTTEPINWLGGSVSAFVAVVLADAWKTTPFVAVILLAGLAAIPTGLYDQARVDRAGLWRRFRHITLPLLGPVLVVAVLFRAIEGLRVFDVVYVLTGGGPGGDTTSLSLFAFSYYAAGDFGYGSAAAVVLFLIAFALALVTVRLGPFARELRS